MAAGFSAPALIIDPGVLAVAREHVAGRLLHLRRLGHHPFDDAHGEWGGTTCCGKGSPLMFDDLAGKVAVVTGGARGLGFAMAGALVEHGVRMALVDRLPDVAASARSLATSTGADVVGIVCDVTSTVSVDEAFARVVDEFGTPQVLVNAAGIPATQTAVDVTAEFFRQALDVNVAGTFFACQQFARRAWRPGRAARSSTSRRCRRSW